MGGQNSYSGYVFTVTAGRTGTAWLADFLGENLGVAAIHEPLGIDDFGTNMPDIRTMRAFNERGIDNVVKEFWTRKLDCVQSHDAYIETNHTLAKCGLVECIADSELADKTTLIVLTRDRVKQCVSYLLRSDFVNVTLDWQWYLSPRYRNNIVNSKPFLPLGQLGSALWYTYEMEARQRYYQRLYEDRLRFIEMPLEKITTQGGADAVLKRLGVEKPARLPPQKNANKTAPNETLYQKVSELVGKFRFSADDLVDTYIKGGMSLART